MDTNMLLYGIISKEHHETGKKLKELKNQELNNNELAEIEKSLENLYNSNKLYFGANPELKRKYKHLKNNMSKLYNSKKIVQP